MIAFIEDPAVIRKIRDHLKEKGEYQDVFRLPRAAARYKHAYLAKENPIVIHKEVAGDTRQGSRLAVVSDCANQRAESSPCLRLSDHTS